MDAIIMDGKNLASGAVSAVKCIDNPIKLARLVMEKVCWMHTWTKAFRTLTSVLWHLVACISGLVCTCSRMKGWNTKLIEWTASLQSSKIMFCECFHVHRKSVQQGKGGTGTIFSWCVSFLHAVRFLLHREHSGMETPTCTLQCFLYSATGISLLWNFKLRQRNLDWSLPF